MKRILFITLMAASLAGCSRPDADADLRFNQIEERLVAVDEAARSADRIARHNRSPSAADLTQDERLTRVEQALSNIAARLQTLEATPQARTVVTQTVQTVIEAPAPARPAPPNRGPVVSVFNAGDSRLADFITPPAGGTADLFPVMVTVLKGRRVSTGTHVTTRLVESDEVYKDEFGDERKRLKEVTDEVHEYAYETVFDLENLTRTEKRVTVSAGGVRRPFLLKPGEKMAGLQIPSERGASLLVESGSDFKRYTIPYDGE